MRVPLVESGAEQYCCSCLFCVLLIAQYWELSYFNNEPYEEIDGPDENEFKKQCKHLDVIYHGYKADFLP